MATKAKASPKTTTKAKSPAKSAAKPATAKAPAKTTLHVDPTPTHTPAATGTKDPMYPIVDRNPWGIVALVLGIIGAGGVGTIIAGAVSKRHMARDITFGILQLIPIIGWIWGLVWGILIFVKGNE